MPSPRKGQLISGAAATSPALCLVTGVTSP